MKRKKITGGPTGENPRKRSRDSSFFSDVKTPSSDKYIRRTIGVLLRTVMDELEWSHFTAFNITEQRLREFLVGDSSNYLLYLAMASSTTKLLSFLIKEMPPENIRNILRWDDSARLKIFLTSGSILKQNGIYTTDEHQLRVEKLKLLIEIDRENMEALYEVMKQDAMGDYQEAIQEYVKARDALEDTQKIICEYR